MSLVTERDKTVDELRAAARGVLGLDPDYATGDDRFFNLHYRWQAIPDANGGVLDITGQISISVEQLKTSALSPAEMARLQAMALLNNVRREMLLQLTGVTE